MKKILLLAEHDYQVKDFLNKGLKDKGEWIALGPEAMWSLEKRGIRYLIPEDFYKEVELESICLKNHEMLESFCKKTDKKLIEQNYILREYKISPFIFYYFPLVILTDGIKSRIFTLKKILNAFPEHRIYVHRGPIYSKGSFEICFHPNELLWGHILSLDGWNREITFIDSSEMSQSNYSEKDFLKLKAYIKKKVKKLPFIMTLGYFLKNKNIKGVISLINHRNKGTILINTFYYDFIHVVPLLIKMGYTVLFFQEDAFIDSGCQDKQQEKEKSTLFIKDLDMKSYFSMDGISFYPLIKNKLQKIFNTISNISYIISWMKKFIVRWKVRAFLNWGSPFGIAHFIHQIMRKHNVYVFTWQHGMIQDFNGKPTQFYDLTTTITSDVTFVYGKEVEKLYNYKEHSSKIITVGSAKLDYISKKNNYKLPKESLTILYATTNFYGNNYYYGIPGYYSDRLFYEDQLKIMETLKKITKYKKVSKIIIKLHSGRKDPPWVELYKNINKIHFVKKTPSFYELISKTDVILLDLPSTVLLEAICTSLPVFVLLKHWRIPKKDSELLSKRVVCSYETDELLSIFNDYIKSGYYPADVTNKDFLIEFGIHDGRAIERAMEIIHQCISNKSR